MYLHIVDDYIDKLNAGHCLHNDRKDRKFWSYTLENSNSLETGKRSNKYNINTFFYLF